MPRSHFLRWAAFSLSVLITLFLAAGCGHSVRDAAAPPAPAANAPAPPGASAPAAAFQPYTLLPPPPPAPPVATPRHRVLHLIRLHNHIYLADSDRHLYEAGRDPQGHVYPIYRDPATRVTYPLYYDSGRDNLYRLARADSGRFYRNYVGEGRTRFYGSDRDYERIRPSDADRPVVTDSYNTYNDGPSYGAGYPTNNGYGPRYAGYRPPSHHSSHFNPNWLWAIPVIIGAYLLLQPHHHSAPPPVRSRPTVTIVRQSAPVTIINQISQAASVGYRPLASPRPIYVYPPGYTARPGYASAPGYAPRDVGYAPRDVRPHRRIVPVAAAPAAPAARAAFVRPSARPALPAPVSVAARPTARTVPHAALHPLIRQASSVRRIAAPKHRVPPLLIRRPAAVSASRPVVHHAAPAAPRHVRRRPVERPRVIAPPAPRPVRRRVEAARPRPAVRPPVVDRPRVVRVPSPAVRPSVSTRPRPAAEPHRVPVSSAPRVKHPAPRIERPASAPRRPTPLRPVEARPRQVRFAPPVQAREERKRPDAPRREDRPKAAPKPRAAAKPARR